MKTHCLIFCMLFFACSSAFCGPWPLEEGGFRFESWLQLYKTDSEFNDQRESVRFSDGGRYFEVLAALKGEYGIMPKLNIMIDMYLKSFARWSNNWGPDENNLDGNHPVLSVKPGVKYRLAEIGLSESKEVNDVIAPLTLSAQVVGTIPVHQDHGRTPILADRDEWKIDMTLLAGFSFRLTNQWQRWAYWFVETGFCVSDENNNVPWRLEFGIPLEFGAFIRQFSIKSALDGIEGVNKKRESWSNVSISLIIDLLETKATAPSAAVSRCYAEIGLKNTFAGRNSGGPADAIIMALSWQF